jgi:hypothetical protein
LEEKDRMKMVTVEQPKNVENRVKEVVIDGGG